MVPCSSWRLASIPAPPPAAAAPFLPHDHLAGGRPQRGRRAGDGTYLSQSNSQLTTVAVLSPMWVTFSLSENEY
jgi:hypothetical protein